MMKIKNMIALSLAALLLSGCAVSAAEIPAETQPPLVTATAYVDTLDAESLQSLTAAALYRVSADGEVLPQLAQALPADVTAEYAGQFGVAEEAVRGYAFRIDLNPEAAWEDGTPITAQDYYGALEALINEDADFLGIAGADAYRQGLPRQTDQIVTLEAAGFSDIAAAEAAGVTEFYVDMANFWGLEAGWMSVSSRTRVEDYAVTSGIAERFVSPAYIYENYLLDGKALAAFQEEAVGICADRSQMRTMEDVGVQVTGEHQLTLILAQPTTASALALQLSGLMLEKGGLSNGPYRVAETGETEIRLERNPHWCGELQEADVIVCKAAQ